MPNDIRKLRRLMFAANHFRKQNPVILRGHAITPSQALQHAWWFEKFRTMLSTGVWQFSYFKKEGSIRQARGTLCMDLIPGDKRPKSLSGAPDVRPENYETFCYYDLDAAGWRSFRLDLFIGFISQVK